MKKHQRAKRLVGDLKVIFGKETFLEDFKPLMNEYTEEWIDLDAFFSQLVNLLKTIKDKSKK